MKSRLLVPGACITYIAAATSAVAGTTFTRILADPTVLDARYSEGALWNDVDGDGDQDLAVANIVGQNNLFYLNDGAGSFTEVTMSDPTTDGGFSYGGLFADLTNDGWPDLFVVNGGASASQLNFFYLNDGTGALVRESMGDLVDDLTGSWSASSADFDGDGLLDVFVSNFNQNNGLYRNLGGGSFEQVTAGAVVTDGGGSLGSAFADTDGDGDPDLFVANANFGGGQANFFYRNDGGTFVRILDAPIGTDVGNSVGGSFGDPDGDGDLDLLVTNYFSETNAFYRNEGGGTFARLVSGPVATDTGPSVGADWGDYDNDGDLDLFVSNDNDVDNRLYENQGDGTFTSVASGDVTSNGGRSNASTWVDIDADGDLDLFVVNGDQPVSQSNFLYRNELANGNAWLHVTCAGMASNGSAIGARVWAHAVIDGQPRRQLREILGQTGYNAQASLTAEFGLGDATIVDTLRIEWPSGEADTLLAVAVDQSLTLVEGGVVPVPDHGSVPHQPAVGNGPRAWHAPNPMGERGVIHFVLPRAAPVVLDLFDARGRLVAPLLRRELPAGRYTTRLDRSLPSGAYRYALTTGGQRVSRSLIVVR